MSNSAQHPPDSLLEQLRETSTELLLISLAAMAGMALVLALSFVGALPDPEIAPWSAILAGPLLIGTAGLTYLAVERVRGESKPLATFDGRAPVGVGLGLLIALVGVLVALIGSMVLGLVQELVFASEIEEQQAIVELVQNGDPAQLALLAVSAVILAPLTEELLFRGMFFRRLYQRVGPTVAWTLPGLAFALAHWNPVGLVIYVWLGSVFAMAYLYSGRLWVAMLVHALHNAFALAMLLLAPEL